MVESSIRVTGGVAAASSWEMAEFSVHPGLRNAVVRLCGFAEDTSAPIRRHELPGSVCVLIFSFGSPYTLKSEIAGSNSFTLSSDSLRAWPSR